MVATLAETILASEDSVSPFTVSKPANYNSSDQVLIVVIGQHGGDGTELTAPDATWVQKGSIWNVGTAPNSVNGKVFARKFNGAEPASWDFPYNGTSDICLAVFRVTGVRTSNLIVSIATSTFASSTSSMNSPTVTPADNDDLLICVLEVFGNATALSETDPTGTTDRGQTQVAGNFMSLAAVSQPLTSSAATGVRTWTSVTPTGQLAATVSVVINSEPPQAPAPQVIPWYLLSQLILSSSKQTVDPPAPAGGQTAVLAQAVETDIARLVFAPLMRAIETDIAQAMGRLKTKVIGQAIETDVSQAMGRLKTRVIGQALETDVSQAITRHKTKIIGQSTETDIAQAFTVKKVKVIGQATETDVSQAISRIKTKVIGQALETDISQAFGRLKTKLLGQPSETDLAQIITPASAGVVGKAIETDTASILGRLETKVIGQTTETDIARIITETKALLVGKATETDIAQSITHTKLKLIGQVTETDIAQSLTVVHGAHIIGQAVETDIASSIISPAPGGVDIMRHFDSSVIFDTANILVTGVGLALTNTTNGSPNRQCVLPGAEVAWDDCDCGGQLGVVIPRRYASNNFPNEAVVVRDCENAIVVAQLVMNLSRCAPSSSDDGSPPSCNDLMETARRQEQDAFVVRSTAQCILESLERTSDLCNFSITEHVSVGPSGGCYATELKINVGFYVNCGC